MSLVGDRSDNWRGSYDGWVAHDRRNDDPDVDRRGLRLDEHRAVDAAQRAFSSSSSRDPKLAYLVARRSLRVARDMTDPAAKADWIKAAELWRGLARMLRRESR